MKQSNQSGFAAVEAVLILVMVAIIGGTGYFVWHAKQNADKSLNNSAGNEQAVADSTGLTKSYTDSVGNYTFKYPASWKLVKTADSSSGSSVTVTSPSGETVAHFDATQAGIGGECEPAASDVPFAKGNTCHTIEYLSSDHLGIKNLYYSKAHFDSKGGFTSTSYEPTTVALVTYHYADARGSQGYGIGLTTDDSTAPVVLNKPQMGAIAEQQIIGVEDSKGDFKANIFTYATGSDKSFLTSAEAQTVKDIFKSVTIKT